MEGHGRENIDDNIDLTSTVGWFTTMYPVRLEIKDSIGDTLKCIKENLRLIPNKGLGYGAFRYFSDSEILTKTSLPCISFNYLGQFDSSNAMWQVTSEKCGIQIPSGNITEDILNMNGMVTNKKLKFSVSSRLSEKKHKNIY